MTQKVQVIKHSIKVKLNLTADDWQLYNIAGRNVAARGLNSAVSKKLAAGDLTGWYSVLSKYRKWGASDTEGYMTVHKILDHCGVDIDKLPMRD